MSEEQTPRKLKVFSPPSPRSLRRRSYAAMSRLMDEYALEARALAKEARLRNEIKRQMSGPPKRKRRPGFWQLMELMDQRARQRSRDARAR